MRGYIQKSVKIILFTGFVQTMIEDGALPLDVFGFIFQNGAGRRAGFLSFTGSVGGYPKHPEDLRLCLIDRGYFRHTQ